MAQRTMLSATDYTDAKVYAREREAIFARSWTCIADIGQLANSGDYLATSIAGYPIVVVKDGGTLRAFHNVCRHRGGPLMWDGAGQCSSFVCQYHGWTYSLNGSLRTARDFGDAGLRTQELSLVSARAEAWRGLVFASLDVATPPLTDWLGGLAGECADYPMESFKAMHRSSHLIAANWKVYAENYQEGYHIPLVHPGLNKQIDARQYRVDVCDGYSVHTAPTRDGSATSGAWLWRFPGLAVNLYPNGMCIETYAPDGPQTTRIDYAFFFADDTPEEEMTAAIRSSDTILDEDRIICEAVQRNYASGLYAGGFFSPTHEQGVAHVQQLVLQALAAAD